MISLISASLACLFFGGTSSSTLQVLSTGRRGRTWEWSVHTQTYVLYMPVNMTPVCLLLMQCCSMHVVPGGTGHVWFMWRVHCVPTRRPSAFVAAIYMSERGLWSLTFSLADRRGDRQTPSYRSVFADSRCGDLIQSESCTHVSLFFPDVDRARSHIWRFYCSSVQHSLILAKYVWNAWLKCFIILFYVHGRCLTY